MLKLYYLFKFYYRSLVNIFLKKNFVKAYPNWNNLIGNNKFEDKNIKNKKKILIATSTGGHRLALSTETLFGFSLKLKGAEVEFLLCDGVLNACSQCTHNMFSSNKEFIFLGSKKICSACWPIGKEALKKSFYKLNKFSDFIKKSDMEKVDQIVSKTKINEIKKFTIEDINIGEHANSGVLRYFAKGSIINTNEENDIYVKYFKSALITYFMAKNLFSEKKFDIVVLNHGIYTPQGVISDVAKKFNVKVVTWYTSYRKKTVTLSHKNTYHKTLLNDEYKDWEKIELDNDKLKKIDKYLLSRRQGNDDWIYFQHKNQNFEIDKYFKNNNIDTSKKIVSIFTNVVWDAQLYYEQNIFSNIVEWCNESIDYLKDKNLTVLVRIHPAEITGTPKSNQKMYNEIIKKFKKLPSNVHIIHPEDSINSYSIIDKSSLCLVYASNIATEISALGKPLIVGGEAYIKNKGIVTDPSSKIEYFELIEKLLNKPIIDKNKILRAKKYAYYFYFQRMITIDLLDIRDYKFSNFEINKDKINQMLKGEHFDKGLEVISEGILNGKEFIYDA